MFSSAFVAALIVALPLAAEPLPHWTPDEDIVAHLEKQPDNKTFVAALKASGYRDLLKGKGRFTVLAPTEAAFAYLPKGMMANLMLPANRAKLRQIVGCHIIDREIKFGFAPIANATVRTVNGCPIRFARQGGEITVSDQNGIVAKLLMFDVFEANGQIEVIDGVLTPSLSK